MKIGAFAKKFGVSVDTVRYYIELELLLPDKKASAQYEFTPSCVDDMAFINEMKQYHFTLQEIRQMLLLKRIADFTVAEDVNRYYLRWMDEKKTAAEERKRGTGKLASAARKQIARFARRTKIGSGEWSSLLFFAFALLSLMPHPAADP